MFVQGRDTSGRLGEAEARIETLRYELTTARGDADLYKAKVWGMRVWGYAV